MAGQSCARPAREGISRPFPFWIQLLLTFLLVSTSFPVGQDGVRIVHGAAAQTTSQPCVENSIGSARVQICITAPEDDVTVSGVVPVRVSLTAIRGALPDVDRVHFFLSPISSASTSTLATRFGKPYALEVPTERWVDGQYRLQAEVVFQDGSVSRRPLTILTLENEVRVPPGSDGSWTPATSGASPLNIVAVGDGPDGLGGSARVANLAVSMDPDLFLYLGDVYNQGTYTEYVNNYEPTLGPLRDRTNPVPGNHEARSKFRGYMEYWNTNQHYYSYDSGGWHFIALNSTTEYGQTGPGTPQYEWLRQDLQNSTAACTMVYMHHPRFGLESLSAGAYLQDIWALLATNGVDVVLSGHNHNYQRWKPIDADGQVSDDGIPSYVVGTGGHSSRDVRKQDSRADYWVTANGVLSMSLGPDGGTASFVTTDGQVLDQSSFDCDGGAGNSPTPDATPPGTSTLTLEPVADAMVTETQPNKNFGRSPVLGADKTPVELTYLRFDVQGLSGASTSARLRLWVTERTWNGPELYSVEDSSWSETAITYNSRPSPGIILDDVGAASAGSWVEYDVTDQVTQNGEASFALRADASDGIDFVSREGPAGKRPQLIIQGPLSGTTPAARATVATPMATPISMVSAATPVPTTNEGLVQATPGTVEIVEPTDETHILTGAVVGTEEQGLRCRVEPSTDAPVLGSLPAGSVVPVTGPQTGDFYPVTCFGQGGYASAAYLQITGTNAPASEPAASPIAPGEPTSEVTIPPAQNPIPTQSAELPSKPTVEPTSSATPLPVYNGWQPDAAVPWWWTTDGDETTGWQGTVIDPSQPLEMGYDLGVVQPLGELRMRPTWPLSGHLEVRLSADGVTWYTLTTIDLGREQPDTWMTIDIDAPAQYVQFVATHPAGTGQVGTLVEVELWSDNDGLVAPLDRLVRVVESTPEPTEVSVIPTEVSVPTTEPTAAPVPTEVPVIPTEIPVPTVAPTDVPEAVPTEVPPVTAEPPPPEEAPPDAPPSDDEPPPTGG